jgi:serine protease
VAGYRIFRNGSSTPLNTTLATTTSYTDTTVAASSTYSYTVAAVDRAGNQSAVSSAVSATTPAAGGGGGGGGTAISNGGFESGSLSGWTASGAITGVTPVAHSGSYSALLGSANASNGDSSIAQTFTAPAGSPSLSFYWQATCPDTVQFDWSTATLKDNTTGTTTTPLAKICTTTSTWTQVTATLVAGHSYTLTLTNHDENYPGDATSTRFDDVTVR